MNKLTSNVVSTFVNAIVKNFNNVLALTIILSLKSHLYTSEKKNYSKVYYRSQLVLKFAFGVHDVTTLNA